jgi:methanogenic corrinoid protein MtbC1
MFDAEVFSRTASLFATKREAVAPRSIEKLASDIVQRLAEAAPHRPAFEAADITEESLDAFCDALIEPDPAAALDFIEARRAEGVTRQGVYLGYVGAAACRLGERWDDDRLSLLDVTIGTGHLYALMRALRAGRPEPRPVSDVRRAALFATVPGEDHGIGITVAADLFREIGWEIDLRTGTDHDGLVAHVEATRPHIIGLSLSTEHRLDALVRLVVAIRLVLPHAIIGVAPAENVDAGRLHDLVDIDLVFDDALSACRELERLIRLRG